MSKEDRKIISDMYVRLVKAFSVDNLVVIGGSALLLVCDPERTFGDLDLLVPPGRVQRLDRKQAEKYGFKIITEGDEITALVDAKSNKEVEVSGKTCKNLNEKIGLPAPTPEMPTAMGLPVKEIMENAVVVEVNGALVKIPDPSRQVIMKYHLWLFRANGAMDQKDARDIRKLIGFYYHDAGAFFAREKGVIAKYVKNPDQFATDIKHMSSATNK